MSTTRLLETLLHIERSVGRADNNVLRNLLMDAQNEVLRLQKESLQLLEEVRQLRERREVPVQIHSWRVAARSLLQPEADMDPTLAAGPIAVPDRAS